MGGPARPGLGQARRPRPGLPSTVGPSRPARWPRSRGDHARSGRARPPPSCPTRPVRRAPRPIRHRLGIVSRTRAQRGVTGRFISGHGAPTTCRDRQFLWLSTWNRTPTGQRTFAEPPTSDWRRRYRGSLTTRCLGRASSRRGAWAMCSPILRVTRKGTHADFKVPC